MSEPESREFADQALRNVYRNETGENLPQHVVDNIELLQLYSGPEPGAVSERIHKEYGRAATSLPTTFLLALLAMSPVYLWWTFSFEVAVVAGLTAIGIEVGLAFDEYLP